MFLAPMVLALVASTSPPRIVPSVGSAPKQLIVCDASDLKSYPERCLLASAQGLINRRPNGRKLFVVWEPADGLWAQWLVAKHYVKLASRVTGDEALLKLLPTHDAVVYDDIPFHLGDVATLVAGCDGLLMVRDAGLLKRYHLRAKMDLRGKFASNAQAYKWEIRKYGDRINRRAVSITVPYVTATHHPFQMRDYLVANRIFTFWISGPKEKDLPGADARAESAVVEAFFRRFVPHAAPCFGYPWSGDGYGPGEGDGVTFLSAHAKFLLPTDNFSNLSVFSTFPISRNRLQARVDTPPLRPGARYAAFVMSDGDNLCTWREYFPGFWTKTQDHSFPVGWTMGPTLREVAPPVFDWACEHLPVGSSVGSGVSGVGYVAPDRFGEALGESGAREFATFARLTAKKCAAAGERWLWVMRAGGFGSKPLANLIAETSSAKPVAVVNGYGPVTKDPTQAVEWVDGVAVFHEMIDAWNANDYDRQLTEWAHRPDCPRFSAFFLCNWNYQPADLARVAAKARSLGWQIVAPEALAALAKQAAK